jgi:hypothetical protein
VCLGVASCACGHALTLPPCRMEEMAKRGTATKLLPRCVLCAIFVFFGSNTWTLAGRSHDCFHPCIMHVLLKLGQQQDCCLGTLHNLIPIMHMLLFPVPDHSGTLPV